MSTTTIFHKILRVMFTVSVVQVVLVSQVNLLLLLLQTKWVTFKSLKT
ncbi:Uncharacterised protein [Mycobacterium tuberculosis]|nr:Uncharacterised protein [Mycobacterium tuberculosis]